MSFTLQIFHGEAVRTIDDAVAAIDAQSSATNADLDRFRTFIDEVTLAYPNAGDDADPSESAWPEGLAMDHLDSSVLVVAVNLDYLDENFMAHVGEAAAKAGLHVLDEQNGLFYRDDRRVFDLQGGRRMLPEPQPVTLPATPQPLPPELTEKAVREHLTRELCRRLAGEGFELHPHPNRGDAVRVRGSVEQSIDIGVMRDYSELTLYVSIGLRSRPITRIWMKALGLEGARFVNRMAEQGWRLPDFRLHASHLRAPPSEEARALGWSTFTYAKSMAAAESWLERLVAWLRAEGLEDLARMDSPCGIASYVLNDTQMSLMFGRNELLPNELFHRLVLVGVYDRERKDEWIRGYWEHFSRSGLRYERPTEPAIYRGFKAASEALIEHLDTDDFAREAAALRALDPG